MNECYSYLKCFRRQIFTHYLRWVLLSIVNWHPDDTDDETGQVLHGMDSLPPVLRRYVHEDNRWFQQELSEWEEQFCQTATPQGESTASAEPPDPGPANTHQAPVEPELQSGASTAEPDQRASSAHQPEPEAETEPEPNPSEKREGLLWWLERRGQGKMYL